MLGKPSTTHPLALLAVLHARVFPQEEWGFPQIFIFNSPSCGLWLESRLFGPQMRCLGACTVFACPWHLVQGFSGSAHERDCCSKAKIRVQHGPQVLSFSTKPVASRIGLIIPATSLLIRLNTLPAARDCAPLQRPSRHSGGSKAEKLP